MNREVRTVEDLRAVLVGHADNELVHSQVVAADGTAWAMRLWGGNLFKSDKGTVLTMHHPQLTSLPKVETSSNSVARTSPVVGFPQVPGQPFPDWPADLQDFYQRQAYQRGVGDARAWIPIRFAPNNQELIVGRWVNDEWRVCQSGRYWDPGNDREGEPAHWFWSVDWDQGGVTDNEGPTHFQYIGTPPAKETDNG